MNADADADADAARSPWWIRLLGRVPFGVLYAFAAVLGFTLRYLVHYRVGVARANLRRCFPELPPARIESLLRANYRHLAQVAVELPKLATLSREEMRRRVCFTNIELVRAELDAGRSVIFVASHLCNWEWTLQAAVVHFEVPIDAAYKPLHAAVADRELLRLRARFGARMVAAKKLMRAVARHRHEVRAIALMADQIPSSSGGRLWLRFLGRETAFYPGPAEIARMTGYAAYFAAARRARRGYYELTFHPIAAAGERPEPEIFTARYARLLEANIKAEPADWMWTHRRWKLEPPAPMPPRHQVASL